MSDRRIVDALVSAVTLLEAEANILDAWAKQSKTGGWSTHQVDPQRRQADFLRREAAELRQRIPAVVA